MTKIDKKRRLENKTDYRARITLLKSGKPRIVIRKTNRYISIQYVKSSEARDKPIVGLTSFDLLKHGWPKDLTGSLKSIPACYLAGYLAGKKIVEKTKSNEAIVDLGLQRNVHGSKIYASIKGLIDAGIKIKAEEKVFPSKERLSGKDANKGVKEAFEKVKANLK
ncbi:MAG: 50S ribosomal protein L18 [Candidatus Pacearchaeota archaeon]|jgi:large subunit ribosomal protein L18